MSRYYFHTENGQSYPDEEGAELANIGEVQHWAALAFAEMFEAQFDSIWRDGSLRLVVKDDGGLILFTIEASLLKAPAVRGLQTPP